MQGIKGTIRKVKPTYFFILIENDRQVFAHLSGWLSNDAPREFDEVEFDIIPSHKPQFREQAINIKKIVTKPVSTSTEAANILAGQAGDKGGM